MLNLLRRNPKTSAAAGIALAVSGAITTYIKPWEGLELNAYPDVVGVWTACYGETKGIKPGMKFTKAQCEEMLLKRVTEDYAKPISVCIANWDTLPVKVQEVTISLGYNIGVGAFCKSTLARKLQAGDLEGACRELPKWNKAGGRVVKGLTNRRAAELMGCLKGVPA